MIKIPSVYPLPVSTYRPPTDEVGTEDTGKEKRKKTIRTEEGTIIIPITKKNTGKRQQEEKKEWKTRRATNGGSLEVVVAR
jgi:hypothetical protein